MAEKPEDKPEQETGPKPNLMFVGKAEEDAPLTKINNGTKTMHLPKVDDQKKAFYHKDAGTIVRLFPHLYKHYKEKGS